MNVMDDIHRFLRRHLTPVVRVMFLINIALFLIYWIFSGPLGANPIAWLECYAGDIRRGMIWQLVTYAFCHEAPGHLLFNMLFLWFLGPMVEQRIGSSRFLQIYLIAAAAGGLLHLILYFNDPRPMLGASGAVMAVAVMAAIYYFHVLVYVWGIFPIKLGWLVIIMVSIDVLYLIGPYQTDVANYAHLAGAGIGYWAAKGKWDGLDLWRWRARSLWGRLGFGPRKRKKAKVREIFNHDDRRRRY